MKNSLFVCALVLGLTSMSMAQDLNSTSLQWNRVSVGVTNVLGHKETGSLASGLSDQKMSGLVAYDLFRKPVKTNLYGFNLGGEVSAGFSVSGLDSGVTRFQSGAQLNWSRDRVVVGVNYNPVRNTGELFVGRRL